jgi:L-2-hydroxyglutarate oxidase LhgO
LKAKRTLRILIDDAMMSSRAIDVVIIGAGIIGLSIAKELKKQFPDLTIALFEKEKALGRHASGRNSGVLHAGIYYASDTLKAKLCTEGRNETAFYCVENKLPFKETGKVILPLTEGDEQVLQMLYQRAVTNGVKVEIIDESELKRLEPKAFSITGKALFSPQTSTIDPVALLEQIKKELIGEKVEFHFQEKVLSVSPEKKSFRTNRAGYIYGFLFNASGLYADTIAHQCGVAKKYRLLPFKGTYFELSKDSNLDIKHLLYPVPDLRVPFLGVHFTPSLDGKVFIGPSAIPALGRENYHGLSGANISDILALLRYGSRFFVHNKQGFRRLTFNEMRHYFRRFIVKEAQKMVPSISLKDLVKSEKVGIRPQLVDTEKLELVMDFLIEKAENSVHILNAISPAFTAAFPFARYIVNNHFSKPMETSLNR